MKNMLKMVAIVGAGLLVSACPRPHEEVVRETADILASRPNVISTLPNGQEVYRYCIPNPEGRGSPHWIYMVGEVTTINRLVPAGKSTRLEVTVIVNGKSKTNLTLQVEQDTTK